jgi:hypothetical protein
MSRVIDSPAIFVCARLASIPFTLRDTVKTGRRMPLAGATRQPEYF